MTAVMYPKRGPESAAATSMRMADEFSSPYNQISVYRKLPVKKLGETMADVGRNALKRFDNFTDRAERRLSLTKASMTEGVQTARVVTFGVLEIIAGSPAPDTVPVDNEDPTGLYAGLELTDSQRAATAAWLDEVREGRGIRAVAGEILDIVLERDDSNQLGPNISWDEANEVR